MELATVEALLVELAYRRLLRRAHLLDASESVVRASAFAFQIQVSAFRAKASIATACSW